MSEITFLVFIISFFLFLPFLCIIEVKKIIQIKTKKSVSYIAHYLHYTYLPGALKPLRAAGPLLHVSNVEEHAVLVSLLEFFLGGLLGKCECAHANDIRIRAIEPDEPSNFSLDGVSELVAE